jgi:SAM-dependent methyltransferase
VWKRISRKTKPSPPPGDGRVNVDRLTDEEFLDHIYKKLLGREPDPVGKAHQLKFLRAGNSRAALVLNITEAAEFVFKTVRDNIHHYIKLLPIQDERPESYAILTSPDGKEKTRVFRAAAEGDFDWLERKVIENGYYERPGVWSFLIDEDKRMMADIAAEFEPGSVLDFGCANGAVLKCLQDKGIFGEGVEISRMALDKTFPEIAGRIHYGDLLDLGLDRRYDLILGLDIFEHLNPNKLEKYVSLLYGLLKNGGYLYANIPAYGEDRAFGEIFRVDFTEWEQDAAAGRIFRAVPVDDYGYPKNGHIICAASDWWVGRFENLGFRREVELETGLHEKYDAAMEKISPARRAYYVFSKNADPPKKQAIAARLKSSPLSPEGRSDE